MDEPVAEIVPDSPPAFDPGSADLKVGFTAPGLMFRPT
jgi:hypothetical protein